jgi:hypothetical protein
MKRLTSTAQVIDAFGGNKRFAEIARTTPQAVNNWRKAKTFPASTYLIIRAALEIAGLSVPDSLWAMRRRAPRRSRR